MSCLACRSDGGLYHLAVLIENTKFQKSKKIKKNAIIHTEVDGINDVKRFRLISLVLL